MADVNAIAESIQELTLMEAADLVKTLEEKLGVSAAAAMAMPAGGAGPAAEAVEEQTEFDVILTGIGGNKISVISFLLRCCKRFAKSPVSVSRRPKTWWTTRPSQ